MSKAQADKEFSWAVRERADWRCEAHEWVSKRKLGVVEPSPRFEPPTKQLQCSHLYGRGHNSTRFHPDNAFAHCAHCHAWLENRKPDFAEWAENFLGRERYEAVMRDHHQIVKIPKQGFKDIAAHYRGEQGRMKSERAEGAIGRLKLRNWNDD